MKRLVILVALAVFCVCTLPSKADTVVVNTGNPDGKIATASRPSGPGQVEIETADDFVLSQTTLINGGTFTGLIPTGSTIESVTVEFYHVFPVDSTNPPNNLVPTRTNSPSDVEFADRSTGSSNLTFTTTELNPIFTASNSVVNGISCVPGTPPNCFTGGEGEVTGQEVEFHFSIDPESLPADHYFFVPQVQLSDGTFLWLSAPKPIGPPGIPFPPGSTDLQTWIRNSALDPNWIRVGTDITHQGPFNASFSLTTAPEPCTLLLTGAGLLGLMLKGSRRTG